jgi:hypothetical protein
MVMPGRYAIGASDSRPRRDAPAISALILLRMAHPCCHDRAKTLRRPAVRGLDSDQSARSLSGLKLNSFFGVGPMPNVACLRRHAVFCLRLAEFCSEPPRR